MRRSTNPHLIKFLAALVLALGLNFSFQALAKENEPAKSSPPNFDPIVLSVSSTNQQMLSEVLAKHIPTLKPGPNDANIARLVTILLENEQYLHQEMDDTVSSKFFDRFLETLDGQHMLFLQSDVQEFEHYRTVLDSLTRKEGDLTPAFQIFARFMERLQQRVTFLNDRLTSEKFDFKGDDRYTLDRRKAPRPKDIEEAKQLWNQHLRYEVLQEKLGKEKPDAIGNKIARRYSNLLRTLKEYDGDDVLELYLSSLTHVYDPHSDYMGKSAFESFNIGMKLSLGGIGALLQSEDGYCKIKSLVPNGPAAKSKQVKENDRIVAVAQGPAEPVDVIEMKLNKVVEMIRGKKGSEVRLTIIPADAPDPSVRKVVTLVRDEVKLEDQEAKAKLIEVPSDDHRQLRIGVIDLPSFYADFEMSGKSTDGQPKSTTADVRKLLTKLKEEKVDGVVLDLRRNGGGSLEEAINLTGLFIKEGPVVQVKDHDNKIIQDRDEDPTIFYDGPLIVMTSRFSASASEILAGALQDYGRALIVGDKSTHGKGTVQSLIQLEKQFMRWRQTASNPGALKLTIRKFYRASGSSTQLKGVIPDIILPSVNNSAEVGETSLENPLAWDEIPSAKYEKVNRVQPYLKDLLARSEKRLQADKDFEYVREDIKQYEKALADKSVSLNEEARLKEKQEAEARIKLRKDELKARPDSDEKVYEITLKLAGEKGLPAPMSKTNTLAKVEGEVHSVSAEDPDDVSADDAKLPALDVPLKETKRILVDLIALESKETSSVAAVIAKKQNTEKPTSSFAGSAK